MKPVIPTMPRSGKTCGPPEIPPVLDRYEAKYTIPASLVDPISDFIRPYCSLDKYSEREPDLFYKINSLYFDTPRFHFLRQRLNRAPNRFNMRVRTYGHDPTPPYFLEIKQKKGDVVRKFRAKIFTTDLRAVLDGSGTGCDGESADNAANADLFRRMVHTYNAQPQVVVQYRRKAFVSDCDDYARVTFDVALRYRQENRYVPLPVEEEMVPCDIETCFDSGACVILELKCYTQFVPLWMLDCVRAFQLKQRGFSKFSSCMRPIFERNAQGSWQRLASPLSRS